MGRVGNKILEWAREIAPLSRSAYSTVSADEVAKLFGSRYGGSFSTRAGVPVGPIDQLEFIANAACIAVKSRILAAIPCGVFRKKKSGTVEKAESEPLNEVLTLEANPKTSAFLWKVSQEFNAAFYGDSYSIIDNNEMGQVTALHQLVSRNVRPVVLENLYELHEWDGTAKAGDLSYEITTDYPPFEKVTLPASRILHIPAMATLNGVVGIPPLSVTKWTVAIGKALALWEQDFFGSGFSPAYIAELGDLGKNSIDEVVEAAERSYAGWKSDHGIMAFAGKVTQAQHRLDYAMLDQRERNAIEGICGWHGVPPTYICRGWQSTYNNHVQLAIQFRETTIFPATENDRQAYDRKLLTKAQRKKGLFTKYDTKVLNLQDGKSFGEMMRMLSQTGAITPDEIRQYLGLNPYPDGSGAVSYIQSQNIPLAKAGAKSSGQTGDGLVESESA